MERLKVFENGREVWIDNYSVIFWYNTLVDKWVILMAVQKPVGWHKNKELTTARKEALARMPKSVEVESEIEVRGEQCTLTYNFEELYIKAIKEFKGIKKVKITITEVVE